MSQAEVVDASLFAQLQPHALSRQEALLFSAHKEEYFKARDAIVLLWFRNPCEYLTFEACMASGLLASAEAELAWRAFTFLVKNGYINAGLVHAQATQQREGDASTQKKRVRSVCSVPVRASFFLVWRACSFSMQGAARGCTSPRAPASMPASAQLHALLQRQRSAPCRTGADLCFPRTAPPCLAIAGGTRPAAPLATHARLASICTKRGYCLQTCTLAVCTCV